MTPTEYLRELTHPARSSTTMITLAVFYLLMSLAAAAGIAGIWLGLVVLTALVRYLILLSESRALGVEMEPPGIEFFSLVSGTWSLFPIVPVFLTGLGSSMIGEAYGSGPALLFAIAMASITPAVLSVLVITHSPLQSLNPFSVARVINSCGPAYWYAPATAILVVIVPMQLKMLPELIQTLIELYLLAAFFSVIGAIIQTTDLLETAEIPDAVEPDLKQQVAHLDKQRTTVLNHAYGFVSRGNRDSGFNHIVDWIEKDPDPGGAWGWFFEQMLGWEQTDQALFFAQRYLADVLAHDEKVRAVKIMLRCRLINADFRPKAEDMDAAIDAAEQCGNNELAESLRRL